MGHRWNHTEKIYLRVCSLSPLHMTVIYMRINYMKLIRSKWWWVSIGGLALLGIVSAIEGWFALVVIVAALMGAAIMATLIWPPNG